jgi:4-amino-4-deoxy-L-arabinose transferase-like glycosyltransferase
MVLACAFAVFGRSLLVARLVTIATSVGGVVFTALLARDLSGRRAQRIAGWIAAMYAPSVLLCGQTYAQHLAALCLAAVAWLGWRAARQGRLVLFAATGAALGLGCLTRPSMVSVAPVLAVGSVLAARRRQMPLRSLVGGAAVAGGVGLAVLVPVQAHDASAGAGWVLSTNNERNLFLGNNPYTPDYKTSHLGQRPLDELPPETRAYLRSFYDRPDARRAMAHEAVRYMVSHPLRTARRTLHRTTSFWGFDYIASREIAKWRGWGAARALPLLAVEGGSYVVVLMLAIGALVVRPVRWARGHAAWLIAMALAYEAPYAIAFSGGTYHFPVVLLLVPFSALALVHPARTWRRALRSRLAWTALALFAAVQLEYAYHAITMR